MVQELNIKEELHAMKRQTQGDDILNAIKKYVEKMNFQKDKLTSVCTDWAVSNDVDSTSNNLPIGNTLGLTWSLETDANKIKVHFKKANQVLRNTPTNQSSL